MRLTHFAERPTPPARPGESCGDDPHVRLDSWLSRLMGFFRSPTHAEVVEAFEQRGFSRLDAEHAATDLRLSCRQGRPTPKWIMGKLAGTAYPDQPVPDIEMHA